MKPVALTSLVVAVLLACAAAAPAQSLADVARAEAERRKATPTGKVYTDESLRPAPARTAPSPAAPASAAPDAPEPATEPEPEESGTAESLAPDENPREEAYWRKRLTAERDALARAETFAEALQSRINALSADFVNRDDPAQRSVIAADRDKALAELERVRQEIAEHQKAIAALQEEGRRAGVPSGWLR